MDVTAEFAPRKQAALDRVQDLVTHAHQSARDAWRWYYILQGLAIGFAAITPCLILIAKDNANNDFLGWLAAFVPAFAAIAAGLTHVFSWREDGVRDTTLEATLRSERWRFETRTGDYGSSLSDEQALDHLVTQVDQIYLRAVAQWSTEQLAAPAAPDKTPAPATAK